MDYEPTVHEIDLAHIYDKPLNFLIGSGASYGYLPTLALKLKDTDEECHTIETLIKKLEDAGCSTEVKAVYLYYYAKCIRPAYVELGEVSETVIDNYKKFLETIITIVRRRSAHHGQQCNIFTTNYDRCIVSAADRIVSKNHMDFVLNDGTRGISNRVVQAQNFHNFVRRHSIFGQHSTPIPQINLIHMHGSICWRVNSSNIITSTYDAKTSIELSETLNEVVKRLDELLQNGDTIENNTNKRIMDEISEISENYTEDLNEFYSNYKRLPLINPTKRKFKQTVLEEHYYQMLRFMSYELERPNAVMISFGFSFADEHILSLIKRCLENPSMIMFVCCFDEDEHERLKNEFSLYQNVRFVVAKNKEGLNFELFNQHVFSSQMRTSLSQQAPSHK